MASWHCMCNLLLQYHLYKKKLKMERKTKQTKAEWWGCVGTWCIQCRLKLILSSFSYLRPKMYQIPYNSLYSPNKKVPNKKRPPKIKKRALLKLRAREQYFMAHPYKNISKPQAYLLIWRLEWGVIVGDYNERVLNTRSIQCIVIIEL